MSSHDQYSSDEEEEVEEDFKGQTSDVLLGFIDIAIDEDDEEADEPTIEDTFIGGKPIWLHPQSRPTDEVLSCKNCGKKMALLLQAFSPFEDTLYDRVIYLFGCVDTKKCSKKAGSIKVIRGVCKDPKKMKELEAENETNLKNSLEEKLKLEEKKMLQFEKTKDLFGKASDESSAGSQNPFGNSNPFGSSNPFSTPTPAPAATTPAAPAAPKKASFAEAAKKNQPKQAAKKITSKEEIDLPTYSSYFLYVQAEKFKKISDPILEKYKHLTEMDVDGSSSGGSSSKGSGGASSGQLDPGAAKVSSMLDDKFFEAFTNKVKHNPSQVLRYDLGGKPLLYSGRDSVAAKFLGSEITVPKPAYNPSSSRQFELQLLPKAIIDLEKGIVKKDLLDGMEWGTIVACTDAEDYMPELDENHVGYVEEWCGVQWEESV